MKNLILFLMLVGVVIAAGFPEQLDRYYIYEQQGSMDSGTATYFDSEQRDVSIITAEPMSVEDFEVLIDDYKNSDAEVGIVGTEEVIGSMTCYHVCNVGEDEIGKYSYCLMDCHLDGVHYTVDNSISDGTIEQSLLDSKKIALDLQDSIETVPSTTTTETSHSETVEPTVNNDTQEGAVGSICGAGFVLLFVGFILRRY